MRLFTAIACFALAYTTKGFAKPLGSQHDSAEHRPRTQLLYRRGYLSNCWYLGYPKINCNSPPVRPSPQVDIATTEPPVEGHSNDQGATIPDYPKDQPNIYTSELDTGDKHNSLPAGPFVPNDYPARQPPNITVDDHRGIEGQQQTITQNQRANEKPTMEGGNLRPSNNRFSSYNGSLDPVFSRRQSVKHMSEDYDAMLDGRTTQPADPTLI
ncbi:hypothetical protein H4R33_004432 [Dimargaris cristalligena]|uniref:Uncharacterized protein n=1 Tax=Dimargaris cristalligena TaxID=215637 RepID=A0A4P9ZNP5_9FUNG|nr:hypothetical protein H4R33_004432 [Dimargaris cristalligena]RKP34805.1 hypothetical protein BJ085DRAFT_35773 [Dimargaris cristalligena]|eukprot:RKP34805.1 hypothetical protein BJ085DRAFT_35773 [Dimargaris cristalligena]